MRFRGRAVAFALLLVGLFIATGARAESAPSLAEIAADNADISSPRATVESLVRLTDNFHELVGEDGFTYENRGRLLNISQQVMKLFDLREVPQRFREDVAFETAIYLREALARFPALDLEATPDEGRMLERIEAGGGPYYRIPATPLVIRRTEAGVFEGRYQFSSVTVAGVRDWFNAVRGYPYHEQQVAVEGMYDAYFLTPGPMIPLALVRGLPDWMQHEFAEQTVWQWLFLVVTVLVLAGLVYLLVRLVGSLAEGANALRRNLLFVLRPVGVIVLVALARDFVDEQVFLTGVVLQGVVFVSKIIVLTAAVALTMRLGNVLTETILAARRLKTRQIDQQLIRLGVRMLSVLVSVIIVIEGMQQIGFSLATMVAGAGVTGLAIALAAQDTLKNVFGGLMLALDRPFEVGQRVRVKGYDGTIEEVGLRSTKVRTLVGHQISIPNDEAARLEVENIGRRPYIRRIFNVTITYDTPPEKIARAVEILEDILAVPEEDAGRRGGEPHSNEAINRPGLPPRVFFSDLNADSLNLLVSYWFHPPSHWDSLAFAHRVNMQIMERFNAEGIDFAFPSQTLYLAGDSKRPLTPGQPAEPAPPFREDAVAPAAPKPAAKGSIASVEDALDTGGDGGDGAGGSTS